MSNAMQSLAHLEGVAFVGAIETAPECIEAIRNAFDSLEPSKHLVLVGSGTTGVDYYVKTIAEFRSFSIVEFAYDWNTLGLQAKNIAYHAMLSRASRLFIFPHAESSHYHEDDFAVQGAVRLAVSRKIPVTFWEVLEPT